MCTVAVAHRLFADAPIVLFANRDEQRDRPASPPRDRGPLFAPKDEVAGGTWLGVNRHGLVAAVTNRFGFPKDPTRRSRGLMVLDALERASAREAMEAVAALDPRGVSPFHLLLADARELALLVHDGERIHAEWMLPGWTIATERGVARPNHAGEIPLRARAVLDAVDGLDRPPSPERAREILSVHARGEELDARLAATCVHLDELGYGTRSFSYVTLGARPRWLHGEGPTCVSKPIELDEDFGRFLGA